MIDCFELEDVGFIRLKFSLLNSDVASLLKSLIEAPKLSLWLFVPLGIGLFAANIKTSFDWLNELLGVRFPYVAADDEAPERDVDDCDFKVRIFLIIYYFIDFI